MLAPLTLGLLAVSTLSGAMPVSQDRAQLTFGQGQVEALTLPSLSSLGVPAEHLAELKLHIASLPERRKIQLGADPRLVMDISEGEKVSTPSRLSVATALSSCRVVRAGEWHTTWSFDGASGGLGRSERSSER